MKIVGLIAAAGQSTRMGSPKALLPYNDTTAVEHLVGVFLKADLSDVFVTLPEPPQYKTVSRVVEKYPVRAVQNQWPTWGLSGSIRTCLELANDADALIVNPVDAPFAKVTLVNELTEAFFGNPNCAAVLPIVNDCFGHPALFARKTFQALKQNLPNGPHDVMKQFRDEICTIDCDDARILANINSPQDRMHYL